MKKILILLLTLCSSITYSQTGVGYLNYTVYNIINNSTGAYANSSNDFVNMFDITKGATIYRTGSALASKVLVFSNQWIPSAVPNGGAYTGIKIEGYFVPKESGSYSFAIDGDDGVDFSIDNTVVTSFYGAHGFQGYRYGSINLVAGKSYKFMARYENWGGGWGMYLLWKRPSQSQYSVQSDEVTNIQNTPTKKATMNFDFGSTLDKTKFSIGSDALSSTGSIDITNSLDSTKIANGSKGTIVPGQAEWSYMSYWNGTTYVYIDGRKLGGVQPTDVKQIKILDLYEGPVTFYSWDGTWSVYSVPDAVPKLTDGTSIYNSYIRNGGGYYAFACDISFASVMEYKSQSVTMTTTNSLSTLYNSIVTVSDVYLAFKELSNGGLFGNQTGNEFTYGIQYKNADVNDDGIFNEEDTYRLLQHLTGVRNIVDSFTFPNLLKLIPTTTYNNIGKSNWNTFLPYLGDVYNFNINTGKPIDTFNISGTWKGDVNLSHSATPLSNGITTMSVKTMNSVISNEINASIVSENIGGKLIMTISLDPLQQQVVGTQFQLNYDNTSLKFEKIDFTTKGNPMNYGVDRGNYINIGSLISDGSTTLDKTTEYKITFLPLTILSDILGMTSISTTDAVNKNGVQLKIKIN